MRTTQTHKANGLAVTVTVETAPLTIAFADIQTRVEPDEDHTEAPWDDCDGWEHEATPLRYGPEHDDQRNSDRYVYSDRTAHWLTLDVEKAGICTADYFRAQGCSKQVAAEKAARHLATAYTTLHDWYANGWEYFGAIASYTDENGNELAEASVWGIDDEDYAEQTAKDEMAVDVAHQLETQGYTVTGKPAPWNGAEAKRTQFKAKLKRNLGWE